MQSLVNKATLIGAVFFTTALASQASTVNTTLTDLGTVTSIGSFVTDTVDGSFTDLYNLQVGPNLGSVFDVLGVDISGSGITLDTAALYKGAYSTVASLGSASSIANNVMPISVTVTGITSEVLATHGGTLDPMTDYTLVVSGTSVGASQYVGLVSLAAVPEPETYAMLVAGLGMIGAAIQRRRRNT